MAAKQGLVDAQYNLGTMYYQGRGVDQDDSMAMRWYANAAAQGDMEARAKVGAIVAERRASSSAAAAESSPSPALEGEQEHEKKKKGKKSGGKKEKKKRRG